MRMPVPMGIALAKITSLVFILASFIIAVLMRKRVMSSCLLSKMEQLLTYLEKSPRCLDRSRECGSWLTTMPNTFNGTVLSAEEFRDSLRLRFGLQPKGLPAMSDGCGAKFGVEHALNCKAGGMVLLRHDNVSAEWQQMCVAASMGSGSAPPKPFSTFESRT